MNSHWSNLNPLNWDALIIATATGAEIASQERVPTKTGEPCLAVVVEGMMNACHKLGHDHDRERASFAVNLESGAVLVAYIMIGFERAGIDPATIRAMIDQKRAEIRDDGFLS